jgi:hypothetical protein
VHYGTAEERLNWLRQRIAQFAGKLASSGIPDDKPSTAMAYLLAIHKVTDFTNWKRATKTRWWPVRKPV